MCSGSGLLLQVGEGKKIPVEIESLKLDFHLGGMFVNNLPVFKKKKKLPNKSSFKGSIYSGLNYHNATEMEIEFQRLNFQWEFFQWQLAVNSFELSA